jgi:hypothetical protein
MITFCHIIVDANKKKMIFVHITVCTNKENDHFRVLLLIPKMKISIFSTKKKTMFCHIAVSTNKENDRF